MDEDVPQELLEFFLLIDEAENRLNRLGGEQYMSVGPPLHQLESLRDEVWAYAVSYDVVSSDVNATALRAEARKELNIEVEEDGCSEST